MKKNILLLMLLAPAFVMANSTRESSGRTTITRVLSYNEFGAGDAVFQVANPGSQCFGYWITKGDPGFEANLSMIIAAYQAKSTVIVHGLTAENKKWAGSSHNWCKLYAIEYR
ncbi:hypothetical protein AB2S62_13540 [Vibrio sp. NTOU-M3]|uniref:hypothetical protein n=1 Tax=Vibrio sp. NTOU-M3 TaxID=3234954 RepID=UPI00349F8BFC